MERDILDDPVALVEDAEDSDALRHRSDARLIGPGRGRFARRRGGILLFTSFAARRQRGQEQDRCCDSPHAYSGIQGS
jgi:hypothetical protein